jgi:ketosteroid isomerase-like protein
MKFKKRRGLKLFAVAALVPMMACSALAQQKQPVQGSSVKMSAQDKAVVQQVTQTVRDFLAAVPAGEKKTFDDFFADDVIYTRAAGVTVNKAEIIKNIGVRAANEPQATYDADDFTVHPYGNIAVVNFRLIQHNGAETNYFRNTGTFLKRNGRWQAVAWQATKVPLAEDKK